MDKGIRPACNALFAKMNPARKAGEMTNTAFRKAIIASLMDDFGITLASAATHYNHSLQKTKVEAPAEVEGLGRAEDKKGGRKSNAVKAAVAEAAANSTFQLADTIGVDEPVQELYNVVRKTDGKVLAEGLDIMAARAMVEAAHAGKKVGPNKLRAKEAYFV